MSNIKWSFSTELNNSSVIDEVESRLSIEIPNELKNLIKEHNAGYPSPSKCIIPNFGESEVKLLLSYNENDEENIFDVLDYFLKKYHKRVLPFASDPGSGYFCIKDDIVVYVSSLLTLDLEYFLDLLR